MHGFVKTRLKYRWRAYRWSFWCLLRAPSFGWVLGMKWLYGRYVMAYIPRPIEPRRPRLVGIPMT